MLYINRLQRKGKANYKLTEDRSEEEVEVKKEYALDFISWVEKYWMILGQIIFFIFVGFTFKSNLKQLKLAV